MDLEIIQPGSLGDIFFVQKLCKVLSQSYRVHHKILPIFWNTGVDQLTTPVNCGPNIQIPNEGLQYDPGSIAIGRDPAETMSCKYTEAEITYDDWADYLTYTRYPEREQRLREQLNIQEGEPYILANKYYGFNNIHRGVEKVIPKDYDGKVIWMDSSITPKIFDWCWLFENAEQIHSVDTSIHYIIETLELKAKRSNNTP